MSEALRLTEREGAAFWPLYEQCRAELDELGDGLVKLVLEHAGVHPDVPEARAERMLKDYTALKRKLADKRAWYFKRAGKALSAANATARRSVKSKPGWIVVLRFRLPNPANSQY